EEDPPTPSTRLSSTEGLPAIAANRGLEPRPLTRLVKGELDWIAMKCLEKDRNRRYETASALAADVRRYLADQPVQACPPSAAYRLRKPLRRHRTAVAVAAALGLALLVAVGSAGWAWRDVTERRKTTQEEVAERRREVASALEDVERLHREGKWPEAEAA